MDRSSLTSRMALDRTRSTKTPLIHPPIKHVPTPESTIVRNQDRFCSKCETLDLKTFFSRRSPVSSETTLTELPKFSFLNDAECPLCRIFRHFYTPWFRFHPEGIHYRMTIISYLNLSDGTDMLREFDANSAESFLAVAYIPRPKRALDTLKPPITDAGCILKLQYPARTTTSEIESSQANLLNSEIDFAQLNAWLDECCKSHTSSCSTFTESEPISGMRVIDVHTRDVVPSTLEFDYAALSYVWGAGDTGSPQLGILNTTSKTIEDALEVTKRLGIPYLWVDRYCIRQDRPDEKHDQISKMHLIYHNARVTIIAAAGSGPEHGIPGISGTSRIPQPHAGLENGLLAAAFPHPTSVIRKSKWASRGWTYQEAALSRRRLAFTKYGAYFECNGPSLSEGIEEPIRRMTSISPRKLQPRLCGGISAWPSHSIWQHINEFSKRNVSYQEDRLNALLGIFGALERSQKVKGHLWGIPIHAFSTSAFIKSLMWEIKGPTGRNLQLPSWSWTGWKGEIVDHDPLDKDFLLQERFYINSSRVNAFVELLNGDIIPLENCYEVSGESIKNELVSKYIHIRAPAFKCRFDFEHRYPNGLSCRLQWPPGDFLHSGVLNFPSVELFTLWQTEEANLDKRLATETWDVIFWRVRRNRAYFLVLHQFNGCVERFGHFWGDRHMFQQLELISEDQTFRLG